MPPDVKQRDRGKQNDKEHHDRASFVHIVFEKTSSSIPMLFVHVGKRSSETLRSSHSQMFFKIVILKNSLRNTCVGVSFLIKMQTYSPETLFKRDSNTGVFLTVLQNI